MFFQQISTMDKSFKISQGDLLFEGFNEDARDDDIFHICGTQHVNFFFNSYN